MGVATVVLGVLPAAYLVTFAFILLFSAAEDLFDPEFAVPAILGVLVGIFAILGFVALLRTIRGDINRNVAWCLVGGIVANVVAMFILVPLIGIGPGSLYLLCGPMLVAGFHLFRYLSAVSGNKGLHTHDT